MADNQFNINVGAVLDTKNVPQQLKDLNSQLSKSESIKIKWKLDTGQITTAVKEINQFNSAVGKIKQVRIYDPQSGAQFKNDLVKINEGLQIVNTETTKWTNNLGQLVTQVQTVDSEGNTLITETTKYTTALGQQVEEVRLLDENLNQLGNTTTKVTNLISETTTSTSSKFGQVTDTINGVTQSYEGLITTTKTVSSNGETLVKVVSEYTNSAGQAVKKTEYLNENGIQVATTQRQITEATNTASTATKNFGENAERANYGVKNLGWSLGDAISRLTNFYLASLPIRAVQTAITDTVETVKEFDSALIEFKKVSDLAGESLTKYVAKLAEMGEITGSTMQAMVEASTEFRKSGFSDEDSAKLASIAEKYRNIADEEISAGESASFIIAQMKAFNIEAGQAEHIIDSVNEVANNFSVSSADLASNLGNMSEIMAINNVSMEQQIGMLTGVTEITRNASSASRGLVMISSRLTQVLDDSSSTGKKLTKIYNDLGIELKDENGQLRSHYDILGDLALQWNTLSDNQQKYIALTSAGARQQQNFVALMENWSQVANATTTAYESMGSAQRENEKVMDSIEKKVEVLKSQFQQLVIGKGGLQDFAKAILDIGITLLKFANSDVGQVVIQTTLLTTAFYLVTKGIKSFSLLILKTPLELQGFTAEEIKATLATKTFSEAIKEATARLVENAIAFATSPFGIVAIGLTACTAAAIASEKAFEKYQRRLQDANEELNTLKENSKDAKDELGGLKDALKSTQDRLKEIEELKITNPDDLDILEKETKELERQEKSLERQIALKERELELSQKDAETQARKTLETTTESQIKTTEVVDSFSGAGTGQYTGIAVTPVEELELVKEKYEQLEVAAENLRDELAKPISNSEEYEKLKQELTATETSIENVKSRGVEMSEIILNSADALTSADDATVQYKDSLYELVDGFDELVGITRESNDESEKTVEDVEAEEEATKELEDSIKELAETLGITATELAGLSERFDELTLETFLSQLVEARQEISDTSTVIDNLQEALETASDALEEYNENGYLTIDTFQSLMSISAQYLAALVDENGQLEINQTTLGNLVEQLKVAKIEELQNAAAMEIAANHTNDASVASANAQGAVSAIGNAMATTGQQAATAAGQVATFAATVASLSGVSQSKWTAQDRATVNRYKDLAKQISEIKVNTTKAGQAAKSAGRAGSGAAKSATDATKELNKELEETKSKYDKVISWIKKQYDKKTDAIEKAKDAATDAIEKEIKALEKEKDAILDGIEKETDALEKEKDAREKYWDDQIDALKKANQEKKDALELQEKLDALEKARNTKVKIYKEGQGFVYDVDQTAVAEAQKDLDEYLSEKAYEDELARLEALKDAEMDNYDKRIDALNDYKDKVSASYEEQISALEDHKAALEEQYDAEIEMYNNYKQQFEDMVNAYQEEQDRLLAQQLLGINLESDNWMTRLDNLAAFVNKYNELQRQLDTGNTSVSNNASMKSGGGGGGGSFSGGSSSDSTKRTVSNYSKPTGSRDYTPDYATRTTSQQKEYQARVKHLGKTYASGTSSVKDDEIAIVGENPNKEIVIGSKINNGELMSLSKGTGVVNADSSSTLAGMLNQVGKFGSSGFGSGNGTLNSNINNDTLTINGVTIQGADIKDPQTFVNGLLNLKAEALQRAYSHR